MDQQFEQYIRKIVELEQAHADQPLGIEALRQIAADVRISDADWQVIQATFMLHLTRGQGALIYHDWDAALAELQEALILVPQHVQVLFGLASAYAGRWQEHKKTADRRQAEHYAHQCLRVDAAYSPALNLLSQLKLPVKRHSASWSPRRLFVGSTIIALVVALSGVCWWFFVKTPHNERTIQPELPLPVTSTPLPTVLALPTATPVPLAIPTFQATPTPLPIPAPPLVFTAGLGVPVSIIQDANSAGLEFEIERTSYSEHSYEVRGWITLRGIDVIYLVIAADFFGPDGALAATEQETVIWQGQPARLSGDSVPMKVVEYSRDMLLPELSAVTLTVQQITKQPAPAAYDPFPAAPVKWQKPLPNFDLAIHERLRTLARPSQNLNGETGVYHGIVLEIKNTGKSTIRHLELAIQYFDPQGQPIELDRSLDEPRPLYARTTLAWTSQDPGLKPGQIFVTDSLARLKSTTRDQLPTYQVTVVDIK